MIYGFLSIYFRVVTVPNIGWNEWKVLKVQRSQFHEEDKALNKI